MIIDDREMISQSQTQNILWGKKISKIEPKNGSNLQYFWSNFVLKKIIIER